MTELNVYEELIQGLNTYGLEQWLQLLFAAQTFPSRHSFFRVDGELLSNSNEWVEIDLGEYVLVCRYTIYPEVSLVGGLLPWLQSLAAVPCDFQAISRSSQFCGHVIEFYQGRGRVFANARVYQKQRPA